VIVPILKMMEKKIVMNKIQLILKFLINVT